MVEERRDEAVNAFVVSIEPVDLVAGEHVEVNKTSVVVAESKRLELEIVLAGSARLRFFDLTRYNKVLGSDTIFAGTIDTRFVGEDIT